VTFDAHFRDLLSKFWHLSIFLKWIVAHFKFSHQISVVSTSRDVLIFHSKVCDNYIKIVVTANFKAVNCVQKTG